MIHFIKKKKKIVYFRKQNNGPNLNTIIKQCPYLDVQGLCETLKQQSQDVFDSSAPLNTGGSDQEDHLTCTGWKSQRSG